MAIASNPVIISASFPFISNGSMLNKDALQQLSQLKNTIREQRQVYQGVVRATPKRFGFVKLDDGREAFLDPEQMQRVLSAVRCASLWVDTFARETAILLSRIYPSLIAGYLFPPRNETNAPKVI